MNIFKILGTNYEVFHSRMLAWMLDPNETHASGSSFLKRFLSLIDTHAGIEIGLDDAGVTTEVKIDVPRVKRWRLADVVVRTVESLVLIENKVDPTYQDIEQIKDEIAGGAVLAAQEERQFIFVLLAPGPLSAEIQELLASNDATFVSWRQWIGQLRDVDISHVAPPVVSAVRQYIEFCNELFPSHDSKVVASALLADDQVLAQGTEAVKLQISEIPPDTRVTAPQLWPDFCQRFPDHANRLQSRWAESRNYSAKSWFAAKLKAMAAREELLMETNDWDTEVGPTWGFPKVRIYKRLT